MRFAVAVEKLAATKELRAVDGARIQKEAEDLHSHLRKSFPAVRKHYDKR